MYLIQVAQRADDLARATAFYTELFRAEPVAVHDPPGLVFFDLDGARLMLDGGAPTALLSFEVGDIEGTVERLRAAGTVIESEPHVIFSHTDDALGPAGTDEWQAFVRDSEGNMLGLIEHRPSAPASEDDDSGLM